MTGRRRRTTAIAALGLAAGVLAACGGGDDGEEATPSSTTEETTTTTTPLDTTGFEGFDWSNPQPLVVGPDWTLADCEGDGPLLCLTHPDGRHAIMEHLRFEGEIANTDLTTHETKFIEDFTKDRTTGCGAAYRVVREEPQHLFLADGPALRYGFSGGAGGASGNITERTVQWAGLRDGRLVLVTISGYDPGSCLSPEGEGMLADLEDVVPGIEALLTAAGLPTNWAG